MCWMTFIEISSLLLFFSTSHLLASLSLYSIYTPVLSLAECSETISKNPRLRAVLALYWRCFMRFHWALNVDKGSPTRQSFPYGFSVPLQINVGFYFVKKNVISTKIFNLRSVCQRMGSLMQLWSNCGVNFFGCYLVIILLVVCFVLARGLGKCFE